MSANSDRHPDAALVRSLVVAAFASIAALSSTGAQSAKDISAAYTVEIRNPATQRFHVTAAFSDLRQPTLDVALPVWTPGVYTPKNYALNVMRFVAHDSRNQALQSTKVGPSTWRIATAGITTAVIEFDYLAQDPSWNSAGIMRTYALFTGSQLFLEPVGHRNASSTVRFLLPSGWRVASPLKETADSMRFLARNYDELVDAPTVLGSFDLTRFEAEGKPHFLVQAPAASTDCAENVPKQIDAFKKIIVASRAMFGSLPYDKYVFFCVPEENGSSIEHGNSNLAAGWGESGNVVHEYFHLWNVKRIRPAEMWPYDYSRVAPGPSIWVSEGFTFYYQELLGYRAGLTGVTEASLLRRLAGGMTQLEGSTERHHLSPSGASITWALQYGGSNPDPSLSGELLAALLDLSILHDTQGRRRLDDVMRSLYTDRYLKGRGFTPDDFVRIVSATAGRDYSAFFRNYVTGTADLPFDSVLAFAGYKLTRSSRTRGGYIKGIVAANKTPGGRLVRLLADPRLVEDPADIKIGDLIQSVDGVPIDQVSLGAIAGPNWLGGRLLGRSAGERVTLSVVRAGVRMDIPVVLGSIDDTVIRIDADSAASTKALAIRAAWLKR